MRRFHTGFFLLVAFYAFGQSSTQCSRSLVDAEAAFEEGRLLFVLSPEENATFFSCLKSGSFSKEEEIRAHKLLTKAYLFTDNEEQAEEKLIDLLNSDKEHQLAPEDPSELYFLYSQFKTEPIFRLGFRAGANKSAPTVTQTFPSVENEKLYNQQGENTSLGINFWGEATIEKYIGNGLEVLGGIQARGLSYEVEGQDADENVLYNVRNNNLMLRAPVSLRYNYGYDDVDRNGNRKTFTPYVFGGVSYDYLLTARYTETSGDLGIGFTLSEGAEEADLVANEQVNRSNVSLMIGGGAKLRFGRAKVNYLNVEIRYDNSLLGYINNDNRFANQATNFDNTFVEDEVFLNAVSVSVGYIVSIYKPRKRKQYQ